MVGLGAAGHGNFQYVQLLTPNSAYLVYSAAATNYNWQIKGKPAPPQYSWTTSGLNFIGFPTSPANPPKYDSFLALSPTLQSQAQIFTYQGGILGPTNPVQLFAYHTTPVTRGQAVWIRAGTLFNNYFGPFTVALQTPSGVNFGDTISQYTFHLRNTSSSNVTVSVKLLASETPPAGQTNIIGTPPMIVRGSLNSSNLTYAYTNLPLNGSYSWSLAPSGQNGSDVVVVLGINRYLMNSAPGALFAGILQFTDSFNFTEVDVPVAAIQSSTTGLWVGSASVTQVRNYLKNYLMDSNNSPVVSSNGNYVITSLNTNLGSVASPFPLRLILHNDGTNVVMLQHVYFGISPFTNSMIATTEGLLDPAHLDQARRITATHLPWTATNIPWTCTGHLTQGGVLSTTASVAYDDQASNPFLHTFHPDHDNLDTTFQTELAQGYESYGINRQITLNISPPGNDFSSLTSAAQSMVGIYQETISVAGLGGATRNFYVSGIFSLNGSARFQNSTSNECENPNPAARKPGATQLSAPPTRNPTPDYEYSKPPGGPVPHSLVDAVAPSAGHKPGIGANDALSAGADQLPGFSGGCQRHSTGDKRAKELRHHFPHLQRARQRHAGVGRTPDGDA